MVPRGCRWARGCSERFGAAGTVIRAGGRAVPEVVAHRLVVEGDDVVAPVLEERMTATWSQNSW